VVVVKTRAFESLAAGTAADNLVYIADRHRLGRFPLNKLQLCVARHHTSTKSTGAVVGWLLVNRPPSRLVNLAFRASSCSIIKAVDITVEVQRYSSFPSENFSSSPVKDNTRRKDENCLKE